MSILKSKRFWITLLIIVAVLAAVVLVWWFSPSHLLKNLENEEIGAIQVMDGNTNAIFVIRDRETINEIADNIRSCSLEKTGLSAGYLGSHFILNFGDENDALIKKLVINSSSIIRNEPVEYTVTDGTLCYERLQELEAELAE